MTRRYQQFPVDGESVNLINNYLASGNVEAFVTTEDQEAVFGPWTFEYGNHFTVTLGVIYSVDDSCLKLDVSLFNSEGDYLYGYVDRPPQIDMVFEFEYEQDIYSMEVVRRSNSTISEHAEEVYLQGGEQCPFCASDDLYKERPDMQQEEISSRVTCNNCQGSWKVVYHPSFISRNPDDITPPPAPVPQQLNQ